MSRLAAPPAAPGYVAFASQFRAFNLALPLPSPPFGADALGRRPPEHRAFAGHLAAAALAAVAAGAVHAALLIGWRRRRTGGGATAEAPLPRWLKFPQASGAADC